MVEEDKKRELDPVNEDAEAGAIAHLTSVKEPERHPESKTADTESKSRSEEPHRTPLSKEQKSTMEGIARSRACSSSDTPVVTASGGSVEDQPSSIAKAYDMFQDKLEHTLDVVLSRMRTSTEHIEGTLESKFSEVYHAIDMLAELTIQMRARPKVSHWTERKNKKDKIVKGRMSPEAAAILSAYGFRDDTASPHVCLPNVGTSEDSPGTGSDSSSARPTPAEKSSSGNISMTSGDIVFRSRRQSQRKPRRKSKVLPHDADQPEDQHRNSPFLDGRSCSPASDVLSVLPQSISEPRPQSISEPRPSIGGDRSNSLRELLRQNDQRLVESAHLENDKSVSPEDGDDDNDDDDEDDTGGLDSKEQAGSKYYKSSKKVPDAIEEVVRPWWANLGVWLGVVCLRIAGLEPWTNATKWDCQNRAWRYVPFMLNLLFFASSLVRIAGFGCWEDHLPGGKHASCDRPEVARLFVDVILGLSSLLVIPALGVSKRALDELQGNTESLRTFALKRSFQTDWYRLMSWDFACFMIALAVAWSERIRHSWAGGTIHLGRIHLVLFLASSFTQTFAVYSIMCTARGLKCLVDRFLVQLAISQRYVKFEIQWKVRAALMRRLSSGLEWNFMSLGITATMAVLFGIIDVSNGSRLQLIPSCIIFGCVPFMAWSTAGVTDACQKVPPTINALTHSQMNPGARLFLQSVQTSEAGVNIGGTRLCRGVVMKSFYFTGMAVFGIATNLFDLKIR